MPTPLRSMLSHCVGWLADRRIPSGLRKPIYKGFAAYSGADLSEARLALRDYPSLSSFFVRHLSEGARPIDRNPNVLVSPVDGRVQDVSAISEGCVLQAKGRPYPLRELLDGIGDELELEGGWALTLYLSPRDYHRIHAPESVTLEELSWVDGARYSVAPGSLARRRVLPINERVVLRLESERSPLLMVFVGATNVGRIRVVGVRHGQAAPRPALSYKRGAELGRFELGSTVVLIAPPGSVQPLAELEPGCPVRLGQPLARAVVQPS